MGMGLMRILWIHSRLWLSAVVGAARCTFTPGTGICKSPRNSSWGNWLRVFKNWINLKSKPQPYKRRLCSCEFITIHNQSAVQIIYEVNIRFQSIQMGQVRRTSFIRFEKPSYSEYGIFQKKMWLMNRTKTKHRWRSFEFRLFSFQFEISSGYLFIFTN